MSVSVVANGLRDAVEFFRALPQVAEKAAVLAINETATRGGISMIRRDMRDQINFPSGYLEQGRLRVARKAYGSSLEAVIRGRDRATSLARFAAGQRPENTRKRPIQVQVKNGQSLWMRKAFLVRLNNGNIGLAVRLKPGEQMRNTDAAVALAPNVFLLYGPSVDQVFRGVAEDRAPDIANLVERNFLRQFARLANG